MKGIAYITINHRNDNKETEIKVVITETDTPQQALAAAMTCGIDWSSIIFTLVKDKD